MTQTPVTIELLGAEAAQDGTLVPELTRLVNLVYAESEVGIWLDDAARTTEAEVAALIAAGEIAVARIGSELGERAEGQPAGHPDGRLAGAVRVQRLDATTGEFGMLVAAPDLRGAGIGRLLLEFAERWSGENGFDELQLEVLTPRDPHPAKEFLRQWYTRVGFVPVRHDPFEVAYPTLAPKLAVPCDFVVYRKVIRSPSNTP